MAQKTRFLDSVSVNAFGNVMPDAIITASGGVGDIIFTRANGVTFTLPLAASASSADSLTTASVIDNVITFTKGDLSTFSITVDTGSAGSAVATGSLLTTGSVIDNTLTFTKGDGTSFTLVVATGSSESVPAGTVSSSAQISELGFVTSSATASFITNSQTSSMSVATASYALYAVSASVEIIKEISSSYSDTASYVEIAQTASFVTTAQTASFVQNAVSSSYALTASYALNAGEGSGIFKQTGSIQATTNDLQFTGSVSFLSVSGSNPPPKFDIDRLKMEITGGLIITRDLVVGDDFIVDDETTLRKETTIGYRNFSNDDFSYNLNVTASSNSLNSARFDGGIVITGSSTIIGDITASGQISSSATVRGQHIIAAGQLEGNDLDIITNAEIGGYLNVGGNITSSNITASGTIQGKNLFSNNQVTLGHGSDYQTNLRPDGVTGDGTDGSLRIYGGGLRVDKNITSSGNISASGNIIATNIISEVTENSDNSFKTVVYDSATKKFFRTGSYGGGGGGSVPSGTVSGSAQITELGFVNETQTSSMSVATASYVTSSNIVGNFTTSSIINFPTEVSRSAAAAGFGAGGESIPSGTVSGSAQITELGFVQSSITASSLDTASVSNNTITFTKGNGDTFAITVNTGSGTSIDTGSFISNSQTSSMTVGTASIANFVPFNGNRSVSNQNQPSGIRNVNFGANGLADFISKVYFTNDGPVLDAQNITIGEFLPIGSTVATITATDAEGQAITFGTSSTYTDDFFRIDSSTGVITMNVKSTSSMNTYNDGGTLKAPFPVTATDTFNESGSLTYYIRITPNTAPIWSENSGVGNVTDITESIAEDSGLGTDKDRYYFRDTESDTITIGSGSFSTHFLTAFALTKQSGYVRLDQITSSLDFDLYPTYSFVLTASDEHYESGDDLSSITYLPVKINVTDNVAPTINPQTLTGINEKSNTGAVAGTVFAEDDESNTMTFTQFILKSAFLNSNPTANLTSSLGGASLQNPSSDPFSINPSSGQVTRKSGQFLNVDIADRYVYTTTVRDNFNPVSASADITIPIANHVANTISISSVANIIETATTGNKVNQALTGLGGSNTILLAANSSTQRWEITSTPDLIEATNITASSTTLQLKSDLSSSATVGGDTITLQITASQDNFDTTIQYLDKVVDVELMAAPVLTPSDQTSNLNTNGARPSNNLVLVSITDPQSFTIAHSTWTFTPNPGQALEAVRNGAANSYYVRPTSNLAAGTYGYTASIFNDKGFRAGELKDEFTIAQAPVGSLTTNGTFYIIESALNGVNIVTDPNGRTGTQGDLGVTYSPTYNSAAVSSFASSNAAIAVASNGNLTAGENISGSSNTYPGTITSNITWQDQYGNAGGPTAITVNIAENALPTATLNLGVTSLLTASLAVSGSVIASLTGSDSQGFENITSASLSGTGANSFNLVDKTGASINRKYEIQPLSDLSAGNYSITGSVVDAFNQSSSANLDISIAALPTIPEVYIYSSTRGSGAPIPANYNALLGSETTTGTPIKEWASGSLGNEGPITLSGGVMRLIGSASAGLAGSSLNTIVSSTIGTVNPAENEAGNHLIYLVYPSGSDPRLGGTPTSMGDAFGDSTFGKYLLYYFTNAADKGIIGSQLNSFDLSTGYTASNGTIKTDYNRWTVLGCNNSKFSSTSTKFYVVPTSGSAPA